MTEHDAQLTTQEAADFLGVSRPTLMKLLEDGHISFTEDDHHRRVMLDDLQEYAEQRHQEHIAMFDELAAEENPLLTLDNPLIHR
ncbi:MAG: helix-turn-helix domain-containing protein [Bifidobacterium choerinum]